MISPALLSAVILGFTLVLFVSEKVRHDLVALMALFAALIFGLVTPDAALTGFADPAVITVAAILVVGRALELSGLAVVIARALVPRHLPFPVRLTGILLAGALLSAFMNNIAALVITMPIAAALARDHSLPPAATLMPLAFATILGGMTTLIGTPANLILSSVRREALGEPFGFFTMTPAAVGVAALGLLYLSLVGWRLLPIRRSERGEALPPWRIYELQVPEELRLEPVEAMRAALRRCSARPVALFRGATALRLDHTAALETGDRILMVARQNQWTVAEETGLTTTAEMDASPNAVTAHVVVGNGSFLEGSSYRAVRMRSEGRVNVVAAGPESAKSRLPMAQLRIAPGDQLFIRGEPDDIATFARRARLLEVDRIDPAPVAPVRAGFTLAIFVAAIAAVVGLGLSPAIAFLGAAALLAATRLLAADEIYRSIDWSIIILLAAMIPVGQSFETSGAAAIAAQWVSEVLQDMPLSVVLAALCGMTLLLSIFLNNVATAVIMGPLAIDAAGLLNVSPDAVLIAVLIGTSSDFLTPIGHQNNLLVMGPGGYRFSDYARMGAPLVVIVIATAAWLLSILYGTA